MKKISVSILIIALLGIMVWPFQSGAQVSRSAYFMNHLPVSNSLNPSFHPPNNFFIDLPLISSLYLSLDSPFKYSELTDKNISDDKVYLDKYGILNSMGEVGTVSFDFKTELLKFGFRSGKHFFSFNASKVASTDISLERSLVEFALFGNGSDSFLGRDLIFSKTGFKATFYHEFGFAWAYEFNDKLSFGVRLKYLNGAINAWTERADVRLYTDPNENYALSASTDLLIHTSSAYGYLDEMNFSDPMDFVYVNFSNNHGFGGDIGAQFRPIEKLNLSASVIDLGMINWKDNVKSYKSKYANQKYTFDGFDINDLVNGGSISDSITILDSLDEHFSIIEINENYKSYLTPKAYFGASYDLTKHDQFGFLFGAKFPDNDFITSYTFNYRRTFGDVLAAYINYTFKKNSNQIGFGLSLRAGPLMIYVMNDVVDAIFQPTEVRGYNVHFGISMVFGKPYRVELPEESLEQGPFPDNSGILEEGDDEKD